MFLFIMKNWLRWEILLLGIWQSSGHREVSGRFICEHGCAETDDFDSGCSAYFAQPCSFRTAVQVTTRVKRAFDEARSAPEHLEVLKKVNSSELNPSGVYGFSPLLLDEEGNIVAYGASHHKLAGRCLDEVFHLLQWYTLSCEKLMESIKNALFDHHGNHLCGWVEMPWFDSLQSAEEGEYSSIRWWWHFQAHQNPWTNTTYYIGAGIRSEPLWTKESCDSRYTQLCTTHNIKAVLGKSLLAFLEVSSEMDASMLFTEMTMDVFFTDAESELHPFVYQYDNSSNGVCMAFGHHPNMVGLNMSEQEVESPFFHLRSFPGDSGKELHEALVHAAESGGGWVKFKWVEGNSSLEHVGLVVGLEMGGAKYYIGASAPHARQEMELGPNCEVCSSEYAYPCALKNVQSLLAFAEMEILTNPNMSEVADKISYHPSFRMGPLYIFAVGMDSMVVVAHGGLPFFRGYTMPQTFNLTLGMYELGQWTFELFRNEANSKGRTWVSYDWAFSVELLVHKISYVIKVPTTNGENVVIGAGFNRVVYPPAFPCSSQYAFSHCSEINIISIVGHIASMLLSATSWEAVQHVLDQVNAQHYNLGDMYAVIYNQDGSIAAHGGDSSFTGLTVSEYFQKMEMSSITEDDFLAQIQDTGGEFSGNWARIPWKEYEVILYSFETTTNTNDSFSYSTYEHTFYIVGGFLYEPHPNLCGNCTHFSSTECTDGIPSYCQCSQHYDMEVFFQTHIDECSMVPPSETICVLDAPSCTDEDWHYHISVCNDKFQKTVTFQWNKEKICEGGVSLPDDINFSCDTVSYLSNVSVVVHFFACFGVVFEALVIFFIVYFRKALIIKVAQPLACVAFCIGGLLLNLTSLLQLGNLKEWKCICYFWLTQLSICLIAGSLLVKVYRVYLVFMNKRYVKVKPKTRDAISWLFRILLVDTLILVGATLTHPKHLEEIVIETEYVAYTYQKCGNSYTTQYLYISGSYKMFLLLLSCILSYKARRVHSSFLDATNILAAVYNCAVVVVFVLMVTLIFSVEKYTFILIESISIWWATCISTLLMLFPKFHHIYVHGQDSAELCPPSQQRDIGLIPIQEFMPLSNKQMMSGSKSFHGFSQSLRDFHHGFSSTDDSACNFSGNRPFMIDDNTENRYINKPGLIPDFEDSSFSLENSYGDDKPVTSADYENLSPK